jgi:hypothetical protein
MPLLQWVAYANQPLTTSELLAAIGLQPGTRKASLEDESAAIKSILGPCKNLVMISEAATDRHDFDYHDSATATVWLIHSSVRDFIGASSSDISWIINAFPDTKEPHTVIASRCIEYLHGHDVSLQHIRHAENMAYPLRDYAMRNWTYHLDMAQKSRNSNVAQRLDDLELLAESIPMDSKTRSQPSTGTIVFRAPQYDMNAGPGRWNHPQSRPSDTVIHTRNANASPQLVRCFTTPLQQACFKGSQKYVSQFLKRGADVNARSGKFCSALHVAAYYGHVDIVTTLLEAGADVNLQGGWFGTALQAAIAADNDEVVDVLLEHGADVNIVGNPGNALEIDGNGSALESPDYYDLPVREIRHVTTE